MIDELSEEVAPTESGGSDERVARGATLTERDRQVVAYVAIARYLSTAQLHRLAFPGRSLAPCKRRLSRLAGLWKSTKLRPTKVGLNENFVPPYLRRREYRTFAGDIVEAWALTDAGYLLAEQVLRAPLRVPRGDVSAEFLEHSVALNEVLIGLVDPTCRPCPRCGRLGLRWQQRGPDAYAPGCTCGHVVTEGVARAEELAFRWTTTESTRLPWKEYDRKSGKMLEKVIQPDAALELGGRRLFLECEMGSHSIVGNELKFGATVAKAERYERFIHGLADPKTGETFYGRTFADGLPAEVLFVVPSDVRRANVAAALAAWAKGGRRLKVAVHTFGDAAAQLLGVLPPKPQAEAVVPTVSPEEVRALHRFYNDVLVTNKRARSEARAARAAVPEYPGGTEAVGTLLRRLLGAADGEGGSR